MLWNNTGTSWHCEVWTSKSPMQTCLNHCVAPLCELMKLMCKSAWPITVWIDIPLTNPILKKNKTLQLIQLQLLDIWTPLKLCFVDKFYFMKYINFYVLLQEGSLCWDTLNWSKPNAILSTHNAAKDFFLFIKQCWKMYQFSQTY